MPEPTEDPAAGLGHNLPPSDEPELTPAQRLEQAAHEVLSLQDESARMANLDKIIGTKLRTLQGKTIPDLLAQIGARAWEADGLRVASATKVFGSLSKAPDAEKALSLLQQLGFPGSINTTMTVEFGAGEEALADSVATIISESFHREVALERKIHSSTLAAFGREKLADGTPIDLGMLGLSALIEATVKRK